jgi:hypothetical protein
VRLSDVDGLAGLHLQRWKGVSYAAQNVHKASVILATLRSYAYAAKEPHVCHGSGNELRAVALLEPRYAATCRTGGSACQRRLGTTLHQPGNILTGNILSHRSA